MVFELTISVLILAVAIIYSGILTGLLFVIFFWGAFYLGNYLESDIPLMIFFAAFVIQCLRDKLSLLMYKGFALMGEKVDFVQDELEEKIAELEKRTDKKKKS